VLAGTGPVGMRAAALLGKEGADVTITSIIACGPTAAGERWCRLDCSIEGSTCPEGMACENVVRPPQQVLVCRFPLQ